MSVKCGNDRTLALVGAGAATEKVNAKFGDDMDPDVIVRAVDRFLKSGTDVRCRFEIESFFVIPQLPNNCVML